MRRTLALKESEAYQSNLLAEQVFADNGETFERTHQAIVDATEIAQIVIEHGQEFAEGIKAAYAKSRSITINQVLYYLTEAKAMPDYALEEGALDDFFMRLLASINQFYAQAQVKESVQKNDQSLLVNHAKATELILKNAVAARLNFVNHNASSERLIFFPPLKGVQKAASINKLEKDIHAELTNYLSSDEGIEQFKTHPEWIVLCTPALLKPDLLKENEALKSALLTALEVAVFLRVCTKLSFDDTLTADRYLPLWKIFFESKQMALNDENQLLLQAVETLWEYRDGIPKSFYRRFINTPVAKEIQAPKGVAQLTGEKVQAIIKAPEVKYAPPQSINSRCRGRQLEISTSPWPAGTFLHLVVRGVARSRKTQNTTIYCFATWEELQKAIIEKPQNFDYQVSGFLCDRSTAFPNANSTSGVPEEFWCETRKVINPAPQVATEIQTSVIQEFEPVLPDNLRTPLTKCQPCVEAMDLANELDWQTHLAEQLIEYIDKFEEIFASIQLEGDLITFAPRTGTKVFNCLETFTVDAVTLKIVHPTFKALSPDLDDELMALLVSWAIAKQEKDSALEKREKIRREISEWRQANEFRKAKGKACREAISFKPWEEYQQGVHRGPKGLELPLYSWDKTCVASAFIPKMKHLTAQLAKAGIKATFVKGLLESQKDRNVVLDHIEFDIKDVGIKFQIKINREAEGPSEIFELKFEDNTPESWQNEAARWAIGTVCMMGIITLPPDKSPLVAGKKDRPNDASHFSFKTERKRAKSSKESKSSYLNLVNRLNNEKGRIKSIANGRGFVWDGSWADFADAGLTVYQNAFFREEKHFDAAKSQVDYDLILNDARWQKYAVLRLWQTLKQGQKIDDLAHRSSVGAFSERMTKIALEAWDLLSPEEQSQFVQITSPTAASEFTFTHGEAENCNFIRTLISMWQKADIGLFVQTEPVFVSFETVMQHCQKEGVIIVARSQEDLDALEELGLPDLKIETAF